MNEVKNWRDEFYNLNPDAVIEIEAGKKGKEYKNDLFGVVLQHWIVVIRNSIVS